MAKAALLLVTLLLGGFTWAQGSRSRPWPNDRRNDPPAQKADDGRAVHDPAVDDDEDEYRGSASRHQPTVTRQSMFPDDDESYDSSQSESRPLIRRRPGARRRRPLDPERRRQLLLRRQQLGLPIRKRVRSRTRLPENQVEETPQLVTSEEPLTYSSLTTSTEPTTFTSTSTSSSMSSSSISSSSSTTSRSSFPSFSAASQLRQRYKKIRDGWGLKTGIEDDILKTAEDESEELTSTSLTTRGLTARRRGLAKVLKRPLPRRLTPTPVPSLTTSPAPTEAPKEDKRLRYRPVLTRKKSGSKVKSTTVAPYSVARSPAYEPEALSYDLSSPVYQPEPSTYGDDYEPERESYDLDSFVYEPEAPFYEDDSSTYEPRPHLLDSLPAKPPVSEEYESEPYYHETEPPVTEQVTNARYTPVPKKVVLEPLTTTPQTDIELIYTPQGEDYDPVYASPPTYTTQQTYGPDAVYASDPTYDQAPVYTSDLKYSPKTVHASDPVSTRDPVYDPERVYDEDPVYAPAYDPDPVYDEGQLYARDELYDESEEYLDHDYEDRPGIFDQYKYGYNVESEDTGNYHARYEARDGRTVSGSYKVALPDGRVQVVTYVADDKGFRAEVNYEGEENTPTPLEPPTPTSPAKKSRLSVVDPVPRPTLQHHTRPGAHDPQVPQAPDHPPTSPQPRRYHPSRELPYTLPADQKIHFHEHVATVSPNPFRLVVERERASTLAPPPRTTTLPSLTYTPINDLQRQPITTSTPPTTTPYQPVTNAHMMDNGFLSTESPKKKPFFSRSDPHRPPSSPHAPTSPRSHTTSKATNAHTITPPHTIFQKPTPTPTPIPSPTPVYHYSTENQPSSHTTLYSPDRDAVAYIHALGRSHVVPVLLPYTPGPPHHSRTQKHVPAQQHPRYKTSTHPRHNVLPSSPRTYYLNQRSRAIGPHDREGQHDGDSVEILRGDERRPRLSLKIPAPHETDIYPAPPPIFHL